MLVKHMSEGMGFRSFAAVIDVNPDSLYEWEKKHPDFSDAIKKARANLEKFFEQIGRSAMAGKLPGFNATAFVWMSKNMIGWKDKQEITIDSSHWPSAKDLALKEEDE